MTGSSRLTEDLQAALTRSPLGQTRALVLEPADDGQFDLADDRVTTRSPGVFRLAVRSDADTSEARRTPGTSSRCCSTTNPTWPPRSGSTT